MANTHSGSVLERTVLKSGPLFLVADRGGDIRALNAEGHGLYFQDMRHLSLFELDVTGTRLTLMSAVVELNSMSELRFTNDALLGPRGELLAEPRTISLQRSRFLHGSLHERIELCNYNPRPVTLTVRFTCGADFRDMFSVRGFEVSDSPDGTGAQSNGNGVSGPGLGQDLAAAGSVEPIVVLDDGLELAYRGVDGRSRRLTRLAFEPAPEHVEIVNPRMREVVRTSAHADQRDEALIVPPLAAVVFQLELPAMGARGIAVSARPSAEYPTAPPSTPGVTGSVTQASSGRHNLAESVTPMSQIGGAVAEPRQSVTRVAHARQRAAAEGSQGVTPGVTAGVTPSRAGLDAAVAELREAYADWCAAATDIQTDHEPFNAFLRRAALDLHLLAETYDGDLVPTAGIPWFAVPFGRDSLITSMQTLLLRPALARGSLRYLARHQGRQRNPARGEAPGKILHEVRPRQFGPSADSIYYGSADATPLFLVALGAYVRWSGDLDFVRELLPNAEAALDWMDSSGDVDGDGFIEMDRTPTDGSLGDQGWKDSPDSIAHRSGQLAPQPVALAEVQAYRFAAHRAMAWLYQQLGQPEAASAQRTAADRARRRFTEQLAFEDEHGPYWAMGLDAAKQRIESVTSNPGHALWVGLLDAAQAELTVRRLLADDMFSGWGIRTLSSRARTYNPMSYHNGAVWPHDTALIALGMKRAGQDHAACQVASAVLEAGLRFPGARLPELWCGFPRDVRHESTPAQYPVGCSPQAWAAGSAFMLLQTLLGLEVDGCAGVVHVRPSLPAWLNCVRLRRMRVGRARVDFDIVRTPQGVTLQVLDSGGLRFEVETVR